MTKFKALFIFLSAMFQAESTHIGSVQSGGIIRDRSNTQIGSAKGIKREWAVAVFFFFFDLQ
jgi:hypothetical protein